MEDWIPLGFLLLGLAGFSGLSWLIVAPFRPDQADNEIRYPSGEIGAVILLGLISAAIVSLWWLVGAEVSAEFQSDTRFVALVALLLAAYSGPLAIWRWRWCLLFTDHGISEMRWGQHYRDHDWSDVELGIDDFYDDYPHIQLATRRKIPVPATKRNRQVLLSWFSRAGKSVHPDVRMPFWWRWGR